MAVPKLGAVKVTNTAGCAAMDSDIPWRPPHTPAVTSCHVSCRRHTNPSTTGTQPRGGFCNAPTPCAAGPPRRHRPDGSGGRKTRSRPPSTTNVKPRPPRPADQLAYRQRRRHPRDNRPPQRCRRPIAAQPASMTVTLTAGSDNPAAKTSGPANHGDQHRSQRRGGSRPLGAPVRRHGPGSPTAAEQPKRCQRHAMSSIV